MVGPTAHTRTAPTGPDGTGLNGTSSFAHGAGTSPCGRLAAEPGPKRRTEWDDDPSTILRGLPESPGCGTPCSPHQSRCPTAIP